jgi:hypothetical protein
MKCWAVLRVRLRDRCPPYINPGTYPLAHRFSKLSNNRFWHISTAVTFIFKSKNQSKSWQFFEAFEATGTQEFLF